MIDMFISHDAYQNQQGFIAPIVTMADVKGEIVYTDRKHPFFLIVEGNKFYIGHPAVNPEYPGDDQDYTWGQLADCSTPETLCKGVGAHIFVRRRSGRAPISYYDQTVVTAWSSPQGGWSGAGAWYPSAIMLSKDSVPDIDRPQLTYQYDVNARGTVTRILVTYWRIGSGKPLIHELKLETRKGIQL